MSRYAASEVFLTRIAADVPSRLSQSMRADVCAWICRFNSEATGCKIIRRESKMPLSNLVADVQRYYAAGQIVIAASFEAGLLQHVEQ